MALSARALISSGGGGVGTDPSTYEQRPVTFRRNKFRVDETPGTFPQLRRAGEFGILPLITGAHGSYFFDQKDRAPNDRQCMPNHPPPQMQRLMGCAQIIQIWEKRRVRAQGDRERSFKKKKGTDSHTVTGVICIYTVISSTYAGVVDWC